MGSTSKYNYYSIASAIHETTKTVGKTRENYPPKMEKNVISIYSKTYIVSVFSKVT